MIEPTSVPVTVAVPTYRRLKHLRELLPVLVGQAREVTDRSAGRHTVEILVVDNDPEGGAAAVAGALGAPEIRYVCEPVPGIAAARNRALDEAAPSGVLAFIDDDERPSENWLQLLLDTWSAHGAVAVSGRVLAEYEGEIDPWIRAGEFFARPSLTTGTPIDIAATNNLLLDLRRLRQLGVRFETGLGLSGGEDTLFSRALVRAGGRIVWCNEAVVVDQVPLARMTRSWVLTRAWSHGNAAILSELRLATARSERMRLRLRGGIDGVVRIVGGLVRSAGGTLARSPRHQARGLRTAMRGTGMVAGVLGIVYQEYARAPGDRLAVRTLQRLRTPGGARP